jgi:hypothetical protein
MFIDLNIVEKQQPYHACDEKKALDQQITTMSSVIQNLPL